MQTRVSILFLSSGPGIKKKYNMSASKAYVANRDVVQTALHALGLEKGQYMTGRVLHEVFDEPQVAAAVGKAASINGFPQLLSICVSLCVLIYELLQ